MVRDFLEMGLKVVLPDTHRILAMSAAGGALLDLGAYVMIPARIALHDDPANNDAKPTVTAAMSKMRMGTDLCTTLVLDYKNGSRAVCTTGFNARSPYRRTATITGTDGEVVIHSMLCRITEFTVYKLRRTKVEGKDYDEELMEEVESVKMDIAGMGLNLEADAAARDIRDGRIENALVNHKYTAETLEIFDEARRQGGFVLPEGMERVGRVGVDGQ